jgi:hypothetical protein
VRVAVATDGAVANLAIRVNVENRPPLVIRSGAKRSAVVAE